MWVWSWWRWILGTVTFCAEGGLCERFLSLLNEQRPSVELWDISRDGCVVTATCRFAEYRRLRRPARRTGTRVRAVKKSGLPFLVRPLGKRMGLFAGTAIVLILYLIVSVRIWVVDIRVEDEALADRIALVLEENGVCVGKKMNDVNIAEVRMKAVAELQEIHQLTLYFDGSIARVDVQLQEKMLSPPDPSPANIVAAADGMILSMQVTNGEAVVKVGEAVVKGDLLVCGAVETTKGFLLRHAAAVITARTTYTFTQTVNRCEWQTQDGDTVTQPCISFFSMEVPLFTAASFDDTWTVQSKKSFFTLFDVTLPIGVTADVYTKQTLCPVTYTQEEAETIAGERLQVQIADTLRDATVVHTSQSGQWDGETYTLTAQVVCEENIAQEVPLLTKGSMFE